MTSHPTTDHTADPTDPTTPTAGTSTGTTVDTTNTTVPAVGTTTATRTGVADTVMDVDTDVLIVGAGPVGLYGAYYAGFRGLRTTVIDALPELGGQITAMYPEKLIHDIAGFPAVRGRDLVHGLIEQAAPFNPTYLLGETAQSLTCHQHHDQDQDQHHDQHQHHDHDQDRDRDRDQDRDRDHQDGDRDHQDRDCQRRGSMVRTSRGRTITCKAVVITGGIGKFDPRPLPVGSEFTGRGLAYFVPSVSAYDDVDVVVVGGGDSAVDWANTLLPLARSVTLVHRRERFRAHEHSVRQMRDSAVRVLTSSEVTAVYGHDRLEAVDVIHHPSERVERIKTQGVVAALGFMADLGPLEQWGLDIQARRIVVSTTMETNLPQVYAAGDIVAYHGKVRLIAVGFGEVALAVNNAAVAINPTLNLFPGHSTLTA